ncbi:FixH [Planctomycetes bacterium Pla163]|uniref:FixH n=1 Tax=Rohdeia mirabilis TaxID=2528008 RepID=A0A518CY18_9BACT|nr:FixH [Planctomycetes bacterium Pla163]
MTNEHEGRRRGLPRWAWIAAALLVTHTSAMIAAVVIAVEDPSFTTVPDYYRRAVDWDTTQARRAASGELGWASQVAPSALGERLVVTLTDREGRPVVGAVGALTAFHHAATKEVRTVPLEERGDGIYFATLDVGRVGAWQVTVEAERASDELFFHECEVVVHTRGADA